MDFLCLQDFICYKKEFFQLLRVLKVQEIKETDLFHKLYFMIDR